MYIFTNKATPIIIQVYYEAPCIPYNTYHSVPVLRRRLLYTDAIEVHCYLLAFWKTYKSKSFVYEKIIKGTKILGEIKSIKSRYKDRQTLQRT